MEEKQLADKGRYVLPSSWFAQTNVFVPGETL